MIQIRNPKVVKDHAFAELDVRSGCCCKTIRVMADYDGKLYTNIINIDTYSPIYIGIWQDLINEWEKIL